MIDACFHRVATRKENARLHCGTSTLLPTCSLSLLQLAVSISTARRFILRDPFLSPPPQRRLASPLPRTTWPQPLPLSLSLSLSLPLPPQSSTFEVNANDSPLKVFQEPRIKEEKKWGLFPVVQLCFFFDKWSASRGLVWVLQSTRGKSRVVESQRW